jgi:hypothetical protein
MRMVCGSGSIVVFTLRVNTLIRTEMSRLEQARELFLLFRRVLTSWVVVECNGCLDCLGIYNRKCSLLSVLVFWFVDCFRPKLTFDKRKLESNSTERRTAFYSSSLISNDHSLDILLL